MKDYFDYVNVDTNDESDCCGKIFDKLDIEKELEEACMDCGDPAYPDCKGMCLFYDECILNNYIF